MQPGPDVPKKPVVPATVLDQPGIQVNPQSENEICESVVLIHCAINATNTVRNDN